MHAAIKGVIFITDDKPTEVYVTVAGTVDVAMAQRIFGSFNLALNNGIKKVHMLVHSNGGFIADGIGIYNYLRNIPIELITYNAGQVSSIAVLVFLAGRQRFASGTASFMIHKSHLTTQAGVTALELREMSKALFMEDARVEQILRSNINLPKRLWVLHRHSNLNLTAEEAMRFGLIGTIQDFSPSQGIQIYNI